MFECLAAAAREQPAGHQGACRGGVALLLKVAKSTYPISSISYVGLNIPLRSPTRVCFVADARWQTIGRSIAWEHAAPQR